MSATCPACRTIHSTDMARAIGRFGGKGPIGFQSASGDAPIRATRAEAEQDACNQTKGEQ